MRMAVKVYAKLPEHIFLLHISSFSDLQSATVGLKHPYERHSITFPELMPLYRSPFHIW